jgi:hypothetical protein
MNRAVVASHFLGLLEMVICAGLAIFIYLRQEIIAYQVFVVFVARGIIYIHTLRTSTVSATLIGLHVLFSIFVFIVVMCALDSNNLRLLSQCMLLGIAVIGDVSVISIDGRQVVVAREPVALPTETVLKEVVIPPPLPPPQESCAVEMPGDEFYAVAFKTSN